MANKNATILILNGKHYDALTGEVVTPGPGAKAVRPIDDFGASGQHHIATNSPKPVAKRPVTPTAPHSPTPDVRPAAKHAARHQPQRSATLIRSAVSKPTAGLKRQLHVQHANLAASVVAPAVIQKFPVSEVNPKRLRRAEHVAKSEHIYKFAPGLPEFNPVAAAAVRLEAAPDVAPVAPSEHKSQELFEKAIATATSHEQRYQSPRQQSKAAKKLAKQAAKAAKPKPAHHHVASAVAASFLVLAIGGFVALQNKPALTMRFADAKAGFHASVPGYQPQGYAASNFSYSAGNVAVNYHNGTANRSYTIQQQTTTWNDQGLLDNFVKANYTSYQILQAGQQIVYLYGNNDASWVKDGIWYQLTSGGSLSSSQVLNIATSV